VRTHMGNARGLSGGSGGGRGCGSRQVTSFAASDKSAADLFSHTTPAISESSRPSDCVTGAAILGSFRLEQSQHPLCTIRCPRRDDPPIGVAEGLRRTHSDILPRQDLPSPTTGRVEPHGAGDQGFCFGLADSERGRAAIRPVSATQRKY
jgi:hypothetical protein